MKVYANQRLFNRIREIAQKLRGIADHLDNLASVVQNDMDVEKEMLKEFSARVVAAESIVRERSIDVADELVDWWFAVKRHIKNGDQG